MLNPLNPRDQQFLNNVNRIADQMQRAQRQISTGIKINQVSDSPNEVSALLETRASLSTAQQIQANLGRFKLETDASEQALQSAVQLFDQVQTLGAEGNTATQTQDTRAALASQLGTILQQMAGLAATSVEGRYVFSGDADQTIPYTVDLTQANPVSTYQGSAATRVVQHPNGTTFHVALTAQTIFDSADPMSNVFKTIQDLRTALLANDPAAIQPAFGALSKPAQYLSNQLAAYGATQDRILEATDFGSNLQVQLKTQVSNLEDADLTDAVLQLNQAQVQQQAALQARARIPRTTLFDFLG